MSMSSPDYTARLTEHEDSKNPGVIWTRVRGKKVQCQNGVDRDGIRVCVKIAGDADPAWSELYSITSTGGAEADGRRRGGERWSSEVFNSLRRCFPGWDETLDPVR
jgi:hypothetical protein